MILVAKEARTIPREANSPPTIITGRQPNLLTSTLHKGPVHGPAASQSHPPLTPQCFRSVVFNMCQWYVRVLQAVRGTFIL